MEFLGGRLGVWCGGALCMGFLGFFETVCFRWGSSFPHSGQKEAAPPGREAPQYGQNFIVIHSLSNNLFRPCQPAVWTRVDNMSIALKHTHVISASTAFFSAINAAKGTAETGLLRGCRSLGRGLAIRRGSFLVSFPAFWCAFL